MLGIMLVAGGVYDHFINQSHYQNEQFLKRNGVVVEALISGERVFKRRGNKSNSSYVVYQYQFDVEGERYRQSFEPTWMFYPPYHTLGFSKTISVRYDPAIPDNSLPVMQDTSNYLIWQIPSILFSLGALIISGGFLYSIMSRRSRMKTKKNILT